MNSWKQKIVNISGTNYFFFFLKCTVSVVMRWVSLLSSKGRCPAIASTFPAGSNWIWNCSFAGQEIDSFFDEWDSLSEFVAKILPIFILTHSYVTWGYLLQLYKCINVMSKTENGTQIDVKSFQAIVCDFLLCVIGFHVFSMPETIESLIK